MPSYDVNIPGSGTYRVNSPVDLSEQQVWAALQQQLAASSNPLAGKTTAELEGAKSAPFSISDVITSGAEGLVGSLKSLSDVFGAGSDVSNWLGKERQRVAETYTPERKAEKAREAELTRRAAESGSTWEEVKQFGKTVLSSPVQSIMSGAMSSVPAVAAGFATLPASAPPAIAAGVMAISRTLFGAVQGVGEAKGNIYDQAFEVYKKQGKSDTEAAALAEQSQAYVAANLPLFLGSSALGALDAATGVESTANKALLKAFSEQSGKRLLTREGVEEAFKQLPQQAAKAPTYLKEAGKGFLSEATPEGLQGGYGQFVQNVAATRAGEETPYMQGVLGSAVQEGLVGGLTGTAMSPLQMGVKRGEYVADQFLRQQKAFFDAQDQAMADMQEKQRQRAETEQRLGVSQEGKMLALPAPDKRVTEQEDPLAGLKNPVGNIEKSELSPKIVKYVNDYRKANGLPALKSYSIEDIKDAMPGVDPVGEQADLARIIAAKTGFTGQQTYTPEDVLNVAGSKNIDTGTPGFSAFLERATGESDLAQMTQPQLYSAFKALDAVPASAAPQILPVDTNASRFKQAQYDAAVQRVNESVSQQPASRATVISDIKDATGLTEDRDAEAILNTALREGVLEENLKPAFQVSDAEGRVVGMFEKEQDAKKAAAKKGYSVQKTSTREIAAPTQAAPEKVRTPLPAGYEIEETEAITGTEPAGFQVLPEGRNKPLVTENTLEEAKAKVERLEGLRKKAAEGFLQNIDRDTQTIQKGRDALERMEAAGLSDSEAYKVAKATQVKRERILGARIELMLNRIEEYTAPLKTRPSGQRQVTRKGFTVKKEGKEVGTFPTRLEAEGSVLAQLSDEELATLASDTRYGGIADRARVEQERRASPEKGIRVFKSPITPEVRDEAAEALEQKLMPLLKKLGLMDVGLKVVKAIKHNADGSYGGKLIQIALGAKNPITTLRHEAIHALKELGFFTPSQWAVLERKAKSEWINKYLAGKNTVYEGETMSRLEAYQRMGRSDTYVMEEAIADAFADFDANKAPPGLMAALMKRLNAFFEALKNAFKGLGFTTASDVFSQVERGELRPQEVAGLPTQTVQERFSLLREAYPDEIEISTQNPQGKTRIYDPISQMLSIDEDAVREAMKANPEIGRRTVQAIREYGFIPLNTPSDKVLEVFKNNIVSNLLFLFNKVPKAIRERSKLWYDGANKIATEMGALYGLSTRQVAGILAAMSPQKDWFQNVSMAERAIDILTNQKDESWNADMLKYAQSYVKEATDRKEREKRQDAFDRIKKVADAGTTLENMDLESAAAFIRAYDEAFNSRNYRIVTPEGGFGDLVRNLDGRPSTMMWSTYDPIEKTVSIFRDGSRENVSQQLGFEHKIRSFYNNIANPNSEIEHVTIDTHAVAAGLFEALAGTDPEVSQNFGATGKSDVIGVGGTYGLIADAYREAARKAGVRAREMQSITWEAVRALFSEEMKASIKPKIRAEWAKYKNGEQSFDQTRQNVMAIAGQPDTLDEPDWVNSGTGRFVSDGGTSYDKEFAPEGGVRLREEKELREKFDFNLSAVTNSIPGLRELYKRAMANDQKAYEVLQRVAQSSLEYLLQGTNARVNIEFIKGVFLSDREPSISAHVRFQESEKEGVLGALKKFAENYNQMQIHVRTVTSKKLGHDFRDGSYATVVYRFPLEKSLSNKSISNIIEKSGLIGFSVSPEELTTYFVQPNKEDGESYAEFQQRAKAEFEKFRQSITSAFELAGRRGSKPQQTVERLYVYGEGYGARIPYADIRGELRAKQGSDQQTPRLIAEYLTQEPVTTFKQKKLTSQQVKDQELLAQVFEDLPINDLKNPLVADAYTALNKALEEQFKVLPIKVELVPDTTEPYSNSAEMRKDVSENNRFRVYKTQPESFGPPGAKYKNHPLLKKSKFTDINGEPMLYNDLLRAVHDYFAHNVSEVQFGPAGEAAAWRNHMAITPNPMARWALTSETRLQNAWQNFRKGVQDLTLMQRGFAEQKAVLPPINFVLTGDSKVDAPVIALADKLTAEQKLGSLSPESQLAKAVNKKIDQMEKFSLKEAPDTPEFKQWFGQSKIVGADGKPMQYYHGTAADITEFKPGTANAIFFSPRPVFSEAFATEAKERLRDQAFQAMDRDKRVAIIKEEADKALASGDITQQEHKDILAKAKRYAPTIKTLPYQIEGQILDNLENYLLTREVMYPVYIRSENPFDYENQSHVDKVYAWMMNHSSELGKKDNPERFLSQIKGAIESGRPGTIEMNMVQEAVRALGFDAFYVKESGIKNIAVYSPTQVVSSIGNIGTYGVGKVTAERAKALGMTPDEATRAQERGDIRLSLRDSLPTDLRDAIDITTHSAPRDDGWISRITSAKNNFDYVTFRDKLRANLLNRYQRFSTYKTELERRTNAQILADSSAEAAALQADDASGVAASVLGVYDRQGGIPVYKNGFTSVWNDNGKIKGPAVIFAPLAKYGDPYIYQMFQFWAGVQRGKRLMLEGREKLFTRDDIARAEQLEKKYPEFKEIFKEWNSFNKGLVQYMVDTGVVSPENAEIWTRDADYLPFYRALDDDQTIGPKVYQSMAGVTGPKKLKGGSAQLADFLETIVRNTQSAVHAGMRNVAANRAIGEAKALGMATKVGPGEPISGDHVIKIMEQGKPSYYNVADPLFINAMKSLNMPEIPFMSVLSAPANFLRSWVTKDPGFILANLMRDSMSAWVTSGEPITPIIDTFKEFGAEVSKRSPELEALMNAGVVGGYDYAKGVKQSGELFRKELQRRYGPPEPGMFPLKAAKSVWEGLEKLTEASDAATRIAVYKQVMAETGNEAEAIFRAKEIMNFNRKGSNPVIRVLTAAVPFLNARMQGLDVLYRAGVSPTILKLAGQGVPAQQEALQKVFIARGLTIAALSIMYALAVSGDDEYEKQEEETKDNNWIVPGVGLKIPTPFEVGFLFKTVPERFVRAYVNGDDTHQDFIDAMKRGVINTFAFNPVPQAIKPLAEAAVNYNTFTLRPIVGQGMADVAPEYQVGPSTSKVAEILGAATGLSPLKLDHIYKGYTGTMGTYLSDLIDTGLNQFSDAPKASKRFEQMPVIKRFMADPEARGNITTYYKLKDEVDIAVRTSNFLLETAKPEEFEKYLTDNATLLMSKDFVRQIDKDMKEIRKMRTMIQSSQMDPDEKRDTLTAVGQIENALTQNSKTIKRMIQESK